VVSAEIQEQRQTKAYKSLQTHTNNYTILKGTFVFFVTVEDTKTTIRLIIEPMDMRKRLCL